MSKDDFASFLGVLRRTVQNWQNGRTEAQLNAMVKNGEITAAEAERIAAEHGYAYADGILTALPDVESSAENVVSTAAVSLQDATVTSQQIMNESGRAAVIAYLNGLIAEGALTSGEAIRIVDSLAESLVSRTEAYSYELKEGGAEAARAYLDGLVAEGAVSREEAAQIAVNAADGLKAEGSRCLSSACAKTPTGGIRRSWKSRPVWRRKTERLRSS